MTHPTAGKLNPRGTAMIDRAHTEATIFRVAYLAFTFHSDRPVADPRTVLADDITWCLEPIGHEIDAATCDRLADNVAQLIVDPAANRRAFITELYILSNAQSSETDERA